MQAEVPDTIKGLEIISNRTDPDLGKTRRRPQRGDIAERWLLNTSFWSEMTCSVKFRMGIIHLRRRSSKILLEISNIQMGL